MKDKKKTPSRVALYGMDGRTYKTMVMYLQGPCKGIAVVVDELDAEIDLIDADFLKAKEVLDERKAKAPDRPIILLSLQELNLEGTLFVKKPVQAADLVAAINEAKNILQGGSTKISQESDSLDELEPEPESASEAAEPVVEKKQAGKKHIDTEESKKTSKHRTAADLTEVSYSTYIGHVEGINYSDREQVRKASFNAKQFFLGYVQSAILVSRQKGRISQLDSSWKPLIIFPHSHEIWVDADDKQLRAFAGLTIRNNNDRVMALKPVDQNASKCGEKMENFYDMDAFLWKLAIWTSKGRFPDNLDIDRPVYLKQWPNFTRLIITPHALRISALLVEQPRTMLNISTVLNIQPQFVFVFISAANALGLVSQAKRQADEIVVPEKIKESKAKGLLSKILGRLRG